MVTEGRATACCQLRRPHLFTKSAAPSRLGVARMLDRREAHAFGVQLAIPDPMSMLRVSDVEKIVADGEGEEVVGCQLSTVQNLAPSDSEHLLKASTLI